MELLGKFERIVIIKTLIFDIDLNFLSENDLKKIADEADTMEIDLNLLSYDKLNNYPTYDELLEIFEEWQDDICYMYNDIKDELLEKLNG